MLNVKIDDVIYFQGNLKEMSEEDYGKLKTSMLEHGIISPGLVWRNRGKFYALDCHQRLKTLKQMRLEGIKVPDTIPAVEIHADSKKQAKRFLLQYVSQHGKVSEEELYAYIHDAGLEDDIGALELELSLPDLNFGEFKLGYFEPEETEGEEGDDDAAGEEQEGNAEKFTFVVCKQDAETVHKALTKAEKKTKSKDGDKVFVEICKKYL
ncbi:MAG: hypothetical protein D8M57_13170 [Candidatus Scalindua sp. AMX11]|nr:MAG: hypothetical protein D8M57_13170 [Candidatus Scalindua sp. AMX11]